MKWTITDLDTNVITHILHYDNVTVALNVFLKIHPKGKGLFKLKCISTGCGVSFFN